MRHCPPFFCPPAERPFSRTGTHAHAAHSRAQVHLNMHTRPHACVCVCTNALKHIRTCAQTRTMQSCAQPHSNVQTNMQTRGCRRTVADSGGCSAHVYTHVSVHVCTHNRVLSVHVCTCIFTSTNLHSCVTAVARSVSLTSSEDADDVDALRWLLVALVYDYHNFPSL